MLSITQLMTQVTVGLQSLSVDSFLAIGLSMFIVHKIISYFHSSVAQWFWILLSIFIFYNVAMGVYPVFSFEFFNAIAIFGTAFSVIKRTYKYFNKVTYVAPEIPCYQPRFGLTPEEMELRKNEDRRDQEKHKKQQDYFTKLSKKIDNF